MPSQSEMKLVRKMTAKEPPGLIQKYAGRVKQMVIRAAMKHSSIICTISVLQQQALKQIADVQALSSHNPASHLSNGLSIEGSSTCGASRDVTCLARYSRSELKLALSMEAADGRLTGAQEAWVCRPLQTEAWQATSCKLRAASGSLPCR